MRCHILFDFKIKEGVRLGADFDPSELVHTLHEDVEAMIKNYREDMLWTSIFSSVL